MRLYEYEYAKPRLATAFYEYGKPHGLYELDCSQLHVPSPKCPALTSSDRSRLLANMVSEAEASCREEDVT